MAEAAVIVEIENILKEKDLPPPTTAGLPMGYQIGKSLRALNRLDHVLDDIEKTLKLDSLPEPTTRDQQPTEIAKLLFALKKFAKKQEEEDAISPSDKGYLEYCKNAATMYASVFNSVNLAACTLSYVIHSNRLEKNQYMQGLFITLSLIFLPISLLVLGLAHSLQKKLAWINRVAIMMIGEAIYMAILLGLIVYYLVDALYPGWVATGDMILFGCLIIIPWVSYKRPKFPWWFPYNEAAAGTQQT